MSTDTSFSDPLIRVMALHALAYCERLFYLEEVEEIRLADAAVYAGRRLHEELAADEGEMVSLILESEALGIRGKVDCLRRRHGRLIPYEHKHGRSAKSDDGPQAWPSDRLQACAYALLVAEHIGAPIEEARIRYHADNITVSVPIDDATRKEVDKAVARARELRQSVDRPPVTDNSRLCLRCSLAPVCLPEKGDWLSMSPGSRCVCSPRTVEHSGDSSLFLARSRRSLVHERRSVHRRACGRSEPSAMTPPSVCSLA